ncbi:MAG: GIY-YIG nuclease family protein [Pseudonocardiales bacterium]
MATRSVGFVYVLTNPAMPGMVKVGRYKHLAEDRARELNNTAVPLPFDVAYRAATSHPVAVERRAHELLAEHRVNVKREFFAVTPKQAADTVRQASLDVAGIQAWDTEEPVMLRTGDRIALTLRASQVFVVLPYRQQLPACAQAHDRSRRGPP